MKKRSVLVVLAMLIMAAFLSVSGAYADTMFGAGATLFWDGDGAFGINAIVPQVGWTSAKRDTVTKIADAFDEAYRGIPRGRTFADFRGMEFDDFDVSVLFDLTIGFGLAPLGLNLTSGLTLEFYFLPLWIGTLGAGLGGGWGFIGEKTFIRDGRYGEITSFGAPYIRVTVPYILFGLLKTGVYFDYHLADDPYTQFNVVVMALF
jgi:hypothetical protein